MSVSGQNELNAGNFQLTFTTPDTTAGLFSIEIHQTRKIGLTSNILKMLRQRYDSLKVA